MQNSLSLVESNPWEGFDSLDHKSGSVTRDESTPRDKKSMEFAATMADGAFSALMDDSCHFAPPPPPPPPSMAAVICAHPVSSTPADSEPKRSTAPTKISTTTTLRAHHADPAIEQHCVDETVEYVLRDLPDLTYMLR